MKKTLISVFAVFMLILFSRINASAKFDDISLTVTAQNSAGTVLIKRGFPLSEGEEYNLENFSLTDADGNNKNAYFSEGERYNDGSLKWVFVSFVQECNRNAEQIYYIKNSISQNKNTNISYNEQTGLLENEKIKMTVSQEGIENIYLNNNLITKSLKLYYDDTVLDFDRLEVEEQNDIYVKLKLSANDAASMTGTIIVTLFNDSDSVDFEYRFNSKNDIEIKNSMGCKFENISSVSESEKRDYAVLNNGEAYAVFASCDTERFSGAVKNSSNTGFVQNESSLIFAPIINNTQFTWWDGLSRTGRFCISLLSGKQAVNRMKNPPAAVINPEQFKKSGIIESTQTTAVSERIADTFEWAYDKRSGCFEAGYIPYSIDESRNKVASSGVQHGESGYNVANMYMQTGKAFLYNMLYEGTEVRADVVMYNGSVADACGAMRYRTGSYLENPDWHFFNSHPYYGEASDMYIAYMLSGNKYFKESFLAAVNHIVKSMKLDSLMNEPYPHMVTWNGHKFGYTKYVESRYIIQIRPLMIAYELTGNTEYKAAAESIALWAKKAQSSSGYFYQAYYDYDNPYIHTGQTQAAVKNYIMLYGTRGLSYLLKSENNAAALDILKNESDYLLSELKNYGKGLWDPTGNIDLYEKNEDNTRGKSPMQDIMAAEIFLRTYECTQNEKYFDGFLECMEAWICALGPGGLPCQRSNAYGYGDESVNSAQASQNLTIFEIYGECIKLLSEKKELVYKKGYGALLEVFAAESAAEEPIKEYSYPYFTNALYNGKALFMMNVNAKDGSLEKDCNFDTGSNYLWYGIKNTIDSDGNVSLNKSLNEFETASAVRCPIRINGVKNTDITVEEYNKDNISVIIKGIFDCSIVVENGIFDTSTGIYDFSVDASMGNMQIKIYNSQEGFNKNGQITIDTSRYIKTIFFDNFEEYNTDDIPTGYIVCTGNQVASNGMLMLDGTTQKARLLKNEAFLNEFTLNFDFMQETKSSISCIARITDSVGNKEAVKIYSDGENIRLMHTNTKTNEILIRNYEENQIYNFEIYVNLDKKLFEVYINGKNSGNPYKMIYSDIGNMRRIFDTSTNQNTGIYYIDNIAVYQRNYYSPFLEENMHYEIKNIKASAENIDSIFLSKDEYDDGFTKLAAAQYSSGGVLLAVDIKEARIGENIINKSIKENTEKIKVFVFDDNFVPMAKMCIYNAVR